MLCSRTVSKQSGMSDLDIVQSDLLKINAISSSDKYSSLI